MPTCGEGKYLVTLERKQIGEDLVFFLFGGEKPHIGGVVICEPGKKPHVVSFNGHYDHLVLEPVATAACAKYKTRVVVLGGIHIDHATQQEIDQVVSNCNQLINTI
ncbi:MAG: hypothetical protein QXX20_07665 [Candidatus Thermoplasmatota archaeon]